MGYNVNPTIFVLHYDNKTEIPGLSFVVIYDYEMNLPNVYLKNRCTLLEKNAFFT